MNVASNYFKLNELLCKICEFLTCANQKITFLIKKHSENYHDFNVNHTYSSKKNSEINFSLFKMAVLTFELGLD